MKPVSIAIITNPYSRRNLLLKNKHLRKIAQDTNVPYYEPNTLEAMETLLQTLGSEKTQLLVINGGDGTLTTIITMIRNNNMFVEEPIFALLRGGTTNLIFHDVGLKKSSVRVLRKLFKTLSHEAMSPEHIVTRQVIKLHDGHNTTPHYGFFFGAASIPRIIQATLDKKKPSPIRQAIILMHTIWKIGNRSKKIKNDPILHPNNITYKVAENNKQNASVVFIIATTLKQLLRIKPMETNNYINILMLTYPYQRLWYKLLVLLKDKHIIKQDDIRSYATQNISIAMDAPWCLDGYLFDAQSNNPIRLETSTAVKFLVQCKNE